MKKENITRNDKTKLLKLKMKRDMLLFFEKMLEILQKPFDIINTIFWSVVNIPVVIAKSTWTFVKYHFPEILLTSALIFTNGAHNVKTDAIDYHPTEKKVILFDSEGEFIEETESIDIEHIEYSDALLANAGVETIESSVTFYGKWEKNDDGTYTRTIETYFDPNTAISIEEIQHFINNSDSDETLLSNVYKNVRKMQETSYIVPSELNSDGYIKFVTYNESTDEIITVTQTMEEKEAKLAENVMVLSILAAFGTAFINILRLLIFPSSYDNETEDWSDIRDQIEMDVLYPIGPLDNDSLINYIEKNIDKLQVEIEKGSQIGEVPQIKERPQKVKCKKRNSK